MKITPGLAAIVTGAASGLGRASAQALADAGFKVTIFDLNEEAGEAFAQEIGGLFCKVNIMDEASALAGFEKARAAHGQERVLVHCAQVSKNGKTVAYDKTTGGYKRLSSEDYAFSAEGILVASYRMASLAALAILTSSAAAQDGQVGQVAYGSLKAGVNGLVLPMARDLMDIGVRVNSIMPGIFATPPMLAVKDKAPEIFHNLGKSVPFPKRLGNPPEFGSLVLEMVRNTYFNGQAIRLDGAIRMPPK